MGACHCNREPKTPLDAEENGSEAPLYAGCCAMSALSGGNVLRDTSSSACSTRLKCKDICHDADSQDSSGQFRDAHREGFQLPGFPSCRTKLPGCRADSHQVPAWPATDAPSNSFAINEDGAVVVEGTDETWHGAGVLSWPDGRRYIGQFCHGVFDGEATMTWPDGRRYTGQYRQNKKHGEGDFLWSDGREYSGQWSNGVRHGLGTYTNARGEKRAGNFSQDRPISWSGEVFRNDVGASLLFCEDTTVKLEKNTPKRLLRLGEESLATQRLLPKDPTRQRRSSPSHGGA